MARALLDINVVIALLDQGHVLHRAATRWLERELAQGWATCPITQNGVVRIMAQPAYPNPQPAALVAARLAEACRHPSHAFWPAPISLSTIGRSAGVSPDFTSTQIDGAPKPNSPPAARMSAPPSAPSGLR